MKRRVFLKSGLATAQIAIAAKAGLLWPMEVLASAWPSDAFFATTCDEAVAAAFGGEAVEESDHVQLEAKEIAENGATVPVAVRTDLEGPFTVTLFSVNNPTPAVGRFEMSPQLDGYLSTRIKMAKTGDLVAVVTAGGRHYSARRRIQVTAGGCG